MPLGPSKFSFKNITIVLTTLTGSPLFLKNSLIWSLVLPMSESSPNNWNEIKTSLLFWHCHDFTFTVFSKIYLIKFNTRKISNLKFYKVCNIHNIDASFLNLVNYLFKIYNGNLYLQEQIWRYTQDALFLVVGFFFWHDAERYVEYKIFIV